MVAINELKSMNPNENMNRFGFIILPHVSVMENSFLLLKDGGGGMRLS